MMYFKINNIIVDVKNDANIQISYENTNYNKGKIRKGNTIFIVGQILWSTSTLIFIINRFLSYYN